MNIKSRIGLRNTQVKQRLGIQPKPQIKERHTGLPTQTGDARFRLIQKKRQNISDARDRLAEIAKTSDARVKINKLKNQSTVSAQQNGKVSQIKPLLANPQMGRITIPNVKPFGNRPVIIPAIKKTIVKGNTTQLKGGALTRTVSRLTQSSSAITRTINRPSQVNKKINVVKRGTNVNVERFHPLPNNPHVVTIRNDSAVKSNQRFPQQPQLKAKRYIQQQQQQQQDQTAALRTALSQTLPLMAAMNTNMQLQQMRAFQGNSYQPFRATPFVQDFNNPANFKITTSNNFMDSNSSFENERYRMQPTTRVPSVKRSSYDVYDGNYAFPPPKRQSLPSDVNSRLEPTQRPTQSGFKVMVSNLHPRVTDDDIEELFRNIGTIKYARFVREGAAEVLFVNELDAYKSVDVYHNRQLDGQPMNVMVVTPRSSNLSRKSPTRSRNTQPQATKKSGFAGSSQSQQGMSRQNKTQKSVLRAAGGSMYNTTQNGISSFSNRRSQKMDVVAPDLNTIHHALFSGRTPMNNRMNSNPQVYIKLPRQPIRR